MKAVMLMFDSLNRRFLPNFGCEWTQMPNFQRLAEKTLTFDCCYGGSMPCMPARRELHTGRYNFLHRFWTPMEPFDESVIVNLKKQGVYTHIVTDHFHYWEDGGSGYLTKFDSHEIIRGQQGDPWIGQVERPQFPETLSRRCTGENWRHDWINRSFLDAEEKMPQARTFARGLDFIERNCNSDHWFLQIEAFDPHEPFFTQQAYKDLYPDEYTGKNLDWPDYGYNNYGEAATKHVQLEYAALLSMCDHYLGKLLDEFDAKDLWKDTMLIVNTDHGFLLGEREMMGKNMMPWYDELIHIPMFLYDPRYPDQKNERRRSLVQTIDIAPTLAEYFGAQPLKFADGHSLTPVIRADEPIRETALFGVFGGHINITDGRYVYMRAPQSAKNEPLYEYTLIANHMNCQFSPDELRETELATFEFTRGARVMKIPQHNGISTYWFGSALYDLQSDPEQKHPIVNDEIELHLLNRMRDMMRENEAPQEQYERIGIVKEGALTPAMLHCGRQRSDDYIKENSLVFTPKGNKALNILLSTLSTQLQEKIITEVKNEQQLCGKPIDEELVIGLMPKFLPAGQSGPMQNMMRMFLI